MPPISSKTRKRVEGQAHARLLNFTCFRNQGFLAAERACGWIIDSLERAREQHAFHVWAYVLMPDHVHLLIWPRSDVAPILQSIKQSVANRAVQWTKRHAPEFLPRMLDAQPSGRACHRFWQRGGGYDRNLWSPARIWDAIDYIHMNPVKAGLCADPRDWPWSSAPYFVDRPPMLERPRPDLETIPPDPRR